MKLMERISSFAAAALVLFSAAAGVYADEEKTFKYTEDENMVTEDTSAPTLSFDTSDYESYIHLNGDASKIGLKISNDTTNAYQGQSIIVSAASDKDIEDWYQFAWTVRNADNDLVYPEADETAKKEDEEKKLSGKFLNSGLELRAEELGISYFDGGMVTFSYRINPNVDGMLMGNSCFVYLEDEEGFRVGKELQLKYNDTDSNNTSQWAKGVLPIGSDLGAVKVHFVIPLQSSCKETEVLYLDNITVTTQSGKQVMNLDGYNANAKPQETVQGLKIQKKSNSVTFDKESKTTKSKVKNVFAVIGIVIIALAVIAGVVFLVLRRKKKFY